MHESQSWFEGELASFVIKGRTQLFTLTYKTVLKGEGGGQDPCTNIFNVGRMPNISTVVSCSGERLMCCKTIIVSNGVAVRGDVTQSDILEIRNFVKNNYQ